MSKIRTLKQIDKDYKKNCIQLEKIKLKAKSECEKKHKDMLHDCTILKSIKKYKELTNISNEYGTWQGLYDTNDIEFAVLLHQNHISCVCSGDDKMMFFMKEE